MMKLTQKERKAINSRFSENSLRMMKKRYLAVDEKGVQETPADMFLRVATALADVEKEYGKSQAAVAHAHEFRRGYCFDRKLHRASYTRFHGEHLSNVEGCCFAATGRMRLGF